MRVTTALVELVFLGALVWIAGGSVRNRIRTALPFLAGTLITLIWPVWVIAQAPGAFQLNLMRIPTLYGRWLHEIGMTFDKVTLTANAILTPAGVILVLLVAGFAWAGFRHRANLDEQEKRKALVTALLPLTFVLIAYVPPTMWLQYLAMPVPFILIGLAYPLLALRRPTECVPLRALARQIATLALPAAAVVSVLAYWVVLPRAIFALVPEKWEPVAVHGVSEEIMDQVNDPELVLTLGPVYALEGGGAVYSELSAGDIVYRIADRMTTEQRRITHTVGPATLDEMVQDRPPAAVLVGIEPRRFAFLEEPLRRSVPSDWRRDTVGTLQVYVPLQSLSQ